MKRLREGRWRLLTLLVVLTAGCDLPGKPRAADRPVPADQVTDFDALYARELRRLPRGRRQARARPRR